MRLPRRPAPRNDDFIFFYLTIFLFSWTIIQKRYFSLQKIWDCDSIFCEMIKKDKTVYIDENDGSEGSAGKLKKLKKKFKECQKEKEEYLSQAQRARADLINYRRWQEGVLGEIIKRGNDEIIKELLPVLDSLEMGADGNDGVKQIKGQLEAILEKYGVKSIKAVGENFNPEFHEAIEQVEAEEEPGIIVEEVQRGYLLGDRVLRVSRVKVRG